jgi:hypothetical protein
MEQLLPEAHNVAAGDNNDLPTSLQRTGHNGQTQALRVLGRNALFAARKAASGRI